MTEAQDVLAPPAVYETLSDAVRQLAVVLDEQRHKGRKTEPGANDRLRILDAAGKLYAEIWIEDDNGPVRLPTDLSQ